jgi:thioredoxin-like negative regulator of GroEL
LPSAVSALSSLFIVMRYIFLILCIVLFATSSASAQLSPDDVAGARRLLQQRQSLNPAAALMQQHRYQEAQEVVDAALQKTPHTPEWLELRARLLIQAWRLDDALQVARTLPNRDLWVGRIRLLKKDYASALLSAKAAQAARPNDAEGFLLEADVHFWKEKPELAEAPLRRALELNPLNADARFAYGYAIWRRVDARLLPAMAAQWNLALEIDPLHYVTHWHFGNGHTHLTYADYVQPTDSLVRVRLRGVDSLVAQSRLPDALRRTRELQAEFPESLLPELTRGSLFYMAPDMPRAERLDSAQNAFQRVLQRKANYGPAHNGLAAVIKQRQFTFVAQYDSLEAEIARQIVPQDTAFYRVFRNIRYYPGERVEKMAVQQLGPALAYIPFIARMSYTYVIPSLHQDLTEAMNNAFFRTSTTFDNRQWMDIRGSGGNNASAGIEYVERGSHQERVVLLHEYVHQFHGAVLTDQQSRRIRQLYYDAMAHQRTLDYYAANNESEFFAQSYEAYLSPVKVHPLNHKAMNTRADLFAKDPALFAFLDTLITENRAYLAGDRNLMGKNWAQVYVSLARQARTFAQRGSDSLRWRRPAALLDTALTYDRNYLPALLERAALMQAQRRWAEADLALNVAEGQAPGYAPVYVARASLLRERALAEKGTGFVPERIALYKRALELEQDLSERADLNRVLRELYYEHALFKDALMLAEDYAAKAPAPSTYLRDRKDEAAAFAAQIRSSIGHNEVAFFNDLLARKPQNFTHRAQAIRANLEVGDSARARQLLEEGNRVLRAGGQLPQSYRLLNFIVLFPTTESTAWVDSVVARGGRALAHAERVELAKHLIHMGRIAEALKLLPDDSVVLSPRQQADDRFIRGLTEYKSANASAAIKLLRSALDANPYHMNARVMLVTTLRDSGNVKEARRVASEETETLNMGALYEREIKSLLSEK